VHGSLASDTDTVDASFFLAQLLDLDTSQSLAKVRAQQDPL
jgi:hypothetical protein